MNYEKNSKKEKFLEIFLNVFYISLLFCAISLLSSMTPKDSLPKKIGWFLLGIWIIFTIYLILKTITYHKKQDLKILENKQN